MTRRLLLTLFLVYAVQSVCAQTTGTTPVSVTLVANPGSAAYGTQNTFTASVTPAEGTTPTGTITFQDGSSVLGTGTLAWSLAGPVLTNGYFPTSGVFADVNNDGILDFIALSTNVEVELGVGNGTFGQAIQSTTPLQDNLVIGGVGDLNGDGKADLLVVDRTASTIEYLPGNGDGTFGSPIVIYQDANPLYTAAIADVNGDKLLDVVALDGETLVGPTYETNALVLINQGSGSFSAPTIYAEIANGLPQSVTVADLSGDGYPDLIFSTSEDVDTNTFFNVNVSLNQGNGTFGAVQQVGGTNGQSCAFVVADFNGDSVPDLGVLTDGPFSGASPTYTLSILLGNGNGTFGTPSATQWVVPYSVPQPGGTLFAGSLNVKGTVDLISNGYIIPGKGNGTFGTPYIYDPDFTDADYTGNNSAELVDVADLTNDGLDDIAVTVAGSSSPLSVFLGTNSSQASLTTAALTAGTQSITAAYSGDTQFAPATSSPVSLTIAQQASTTALTSVSPNPAVAGQNVVFQVEVGGVSGPASPSGSVAFQSGSTVLGTAPLSGNGSASFTTSFPSQGNQTVTASYTGDANYSASSTSVVEAILPAYLLAVNQSTTTVSSGQSGTVAVSVTPQNGFSGTVIMACSSLPAYASCSFSPSSSVSVSGTTAQNVNLTISTSGGTAAIRRSMAALDALPSGILLITGLASGRRRKAGRFVLIPLALLLFLPFLTACGGGGSPTGTTTSTASTPAGTYAITVKTTSGGISQSTQITLVVD